MRSTVGLAGAAVAAVLVAVVAVASLLPVESCACATPLDLTVVNSSRQEASVHWNQPGMFGTPIRGLDGGVGVASCSTASLGLRSGVVHVSVRVGSKTREFDVHVRDGFATDAAVIWVLPDGSVADLGYGRPLGGGLAPGSC